MAATDRLQGVRTRLRSAADRLRGAGRRLPTGPTPRRWVRYTLVSVAVLLGCVVFGVTTAAVDASLGPHNARYEVTTNSVVTVDLGPLGTVQLESPMPANLGVTVRIEEIPMDLTSVETTTTLDALASDVQGYLQFFTGPSETISYITKALAQDAARRAGGALAVVLLVTAVGYLALGAARRRELAVPLARSTWAITATVVVATLVSGTVVSQRATTRLDEVGAQASEVFDGTALEGARITGRLSGVIDTYGGQLVGVYEENENFYAGANRRLTEEWELRAQEDALAAEQLAGVPDARPSSGGAPGDGTSQEQGDGADGGTAAEGADGADGTGTDPAEGTAGDAGAASTTDPRTAPGEDPAQDPSAAPSDDPSEDPSARAVEPDEEDIVTLVMVSDLHCNTGMSPLITNLATLSGAQVILNGGDTTINGTAVERFCMDSFASAVPKGVTMVQSDGNHDSAITSAQARDAGVTVLDGEVVEVEGIRILGDSDPRETRIGQGSTSVAGETYAEAGERLRDVACEAKDPVDLLLIHTPPVGDPVMESGCVPVQLSGHKHVRSGPEVVGGGVRYVSSTTAGATGGGATIGPLNGIAEMTVFRFDRERKIMLDYRIVAVYPDASVQVGARLAFPRAPLASASSGTTDEAPGTTQESDEPDGEPTGE